MKYFSSLLIAIIFSSPLFAQQTRFYSDPEEKFKEAREYFQKEQYSLAFPLFKELKQDIRETNKVNTAITVQEINYYATVCALKQNEGTAVEDALAFIELEKNNAR